MEIKKFGCWQPEFANDLLGMEGCGGLFLGLIGSAGIHSNYPFLVPVSYLLKVILFSLVLSGITFILRRKITFLGTIAFLIVLSQVIMSVVMFIGLFSLLFK
ncbi:hypothetical protein ACNFMA_004471 [Escherichia coli]|uniref:hypothetical protein n=2 Tax=Escherichia coli TaxID=562 RepID=UPI00203CCDF1|nr:hypothetical protein [Escherichia coli]MDO2580593.1 hypothetical protein [Escherichia coli]MDR4115047.1 hypothetical protein [Escherichia coli]MEC6207786.1 hypothetical protein [Escherichia coli]